jgi:hypothetical protein
MTFDPFGFARRSKEKTLESASLRLREAVGPSEELILVAEGWRLPPAWVGAVSLGIVYGFWQRRYFLGLTVDRLVALRVSYPRGRLKRARFDLRRETLEVVSFGGGATNVSARSMILHLASSEDGSELRFLFHPPWFDEAAEIAAEIQRTHIAT